MDLRFIWESLAVLFTGYCLIRIAGKKTVGEMTGLEIITLLAIASMTGHAVAGDGLWKTVGALCTFVALLVTIQFLAVKFDLVEKLFMGKATLVIQDGKIIPENLKKLRMSVDQLEAKLREKGIPSFTELKTATIEMSGQLGYEWMRESKPVTIGELEQMLARLNVTQTPKPYKPLPPNLFNEIVFEEHQPPVPPELD